MRGSTTLRAVLVLSVAVAVLGLAAGPAGAATLTWGQNGTGDGDGVWDGTGTNLWWDGAANTDWVSGLDANVGNGGVGGAVTLAGPTAVGLLTMNAFTGTYTLGTSTSTITLNGGLTMSSGAGDTTIISPITLGGPQAWTNSSTSLLTVSGNVTNGGNLLTVGGTGNTAISGILGNGAGGLTKSGAGTLTLTGVETYSGATTVNGGRLSITGTGQLYSNAGWGNRVTTVNSAVLEIDRWWQAGSLGPVSYGSGNLVLNGGTLRYIGSETLTRTDDNNGRCFSLGAGGGTLESNATAGKEWVIANSGDQLPSFSATLTLSGSGNGYIGKVISGAGGAGGSLIKSGSGTWTLGGVYNTYTGGTTVSGGTLSLAIGGENGAIRGVLNIEPGGTVRHDFNNALGYGVNRVATVNINGGTMIGASGKLLTIWGSTYNLTGGNVTGENGSSIAIGTDSAAGNTPAAINTLASSTTTIFSGTGTANILLDQANLTFDVADGTAATDLRISLPIGPRFGGRTHAITKTGTGTMELSGTNTYTGGTTVSAGTLLVNSPGSLAAGSAVTVQSGGTLGGNGTIGGAITVESGGILAPGTSAGKLTVNNSVTMDSGAIYEWQLAAKTGPAGTDWDLISAANVSFGGTLNFVIDDSLFSGSISATDSFIVASANPTTGSINAPTTVNFTRPSGWTGGSLTVIGENLVLMGLSSSVLGDTNSDFVVDAADFITVKQNFGRTDATLGAEQGDFDKNGNVDWDDLQTLMANFSTRTIGEAPAVPEPATLGLLAIDALAVLRRRRAA